MDQRLNQIADNFESLKIGLDEKFKFNCTMCGKCCINRDDILLTSRDIFQISNALGLRISEFIKRYCEVYVGPSSKVPIVRLLPIGPTKRCPLLKGNKCVVHNVKPVVCAMFPIGRCIEIDDAEKGRELAVKNIQYILMDPHCGDNSKEHTVREWLKGFNISTEDEYFVKWHQTLVGLSRFIYENESKMDEHYLNGMKQLFLLALYLSYDLKKEFYPQFVQNADTLLGKLKELKIGGKQ